MRYKNLISWYVDLEDILEVSVSDEYRIVQVPPNGAMSRAILKLCWAYYVPQPRPRIVLPGI